MATAGMDIKTEPVMYTVVLMVTVRAEKIRQGAGLQAARAGGWRPSCTPPTSQHLHT